MSNQDRDCIGAILLPDEGGIKPTFYVLRDGKITFGADGELESADWRLFNELLGVVREHYAQKGGLEAAARAHGAVDIPDMDGTEYNDPAPQRQQPRQPVRQPQRPPQRQQAPQRPPQGETIWCDRCNQPMRAGRVMQGQYGPRRAYDCTSGCFGDKINSKTGQPFPYTTWVDA